MNLYYFFLEDLYEDYEGAIEASTADRALELLNNKYNDPKCIRLYRISSGVEL